jgi:hypothetical protein
VEAELKNLNRGPEKTPKIKKSSPKDSSKPSKAKKSRTKINGKLMGKKSKRNKEKFPPSTQMKAKNGRKNRVRIRSISC